MVSLLCGCARVCLTCDVTVSTRLKSVKNIQKITQSMKMVSSAKFKRAEEALKRAKPMGAAAQG